MTTRKVPHPGWNFEYVMWIFTRISGLAIFTIALIGMIGALLMGARTQMDLGTLMRWTFFPNNFHVINSDIDIEAGWLQPIWLWFQYAIIFFGATHGLNGLRMVLEDYWQNKTVQLVLRVLMFASWAGLLYIATILTKF